MDFVPGTPHTTSCGVSQTLGAVLKRKRNVMKSKQNQKRGSKRKQVVVFNPNERADYITGFRKRKAQRRKDAQDQIKAKAEEELKDIRREKNEKARELLKAYEALQTEMKAEIIEPEDQVVVQQDDFSKKAFGADAVVVTTSMGFDDHPAGDKQADSDLAAAESEHSATAGEDSDSDEASDASTAEAADADADAGPAAAACGGCCSSGACGDKQQSNPFAAGKPVSLRRLLRDAYS